MTAGRTSRTHASLCLWLALASSAAAVSVRFGLAWLVGWLGGESGVGWWVGAGGQRAIIFLFIYM